MSLRVFRALDFRCLNSVEIEPDSKVNLITGKNAAGKTSLLEAIYYLGRGRSFRSGRPTELIGGTSDAFTLFADVAHENTPHRLGAEVTRKKRNLRLDGATASTSDLASLLPVQAIDPEIHNLVQGGPENRRRFLDWGVFHVEPSFLPSWRRYQAALRQRNAALRSGAPQTSVEIWNDQLIASGNEVDSARQKYAADIIAEMNNIIGDFLPFELKISYFRGWKEEQSLEAALEAGFSRDAATQATQVGPHRADLLLEIDGHLARHRLSRGQQKLLAASLVVAETLFVVEARQKEVVLLVDDPAAELDHEHQERLFELLRAVPAQLFLTALDRDKLPWKGTAKEFALSNGEVTPLV